MPKRNPTSVMLPEWERERDDALWAEATGKVDWNDPNSRLYPDWKGEVGSNVRGIWHTLTNPQKLAIVKDALERARTLDDEARARNEG